MAVDYYHSSAPAYLGWFAVEISDIPDTTAEEVLLGPN